ncbi:Zonadhesin [Trachymyrmex zeteki]|uniref:Zonadhesin n=2 Tax=Mycetomoellerius zeteki TaxID=64791 RepID=A0A151WHL3_9HYME|nr:Zonadhesin [Trachymyrmex zeteki]
MLKDRIVGKWREWFGKDSPTPNLSPQDILNIDKTLEGRISGYPGLFLDLSRLSFDPKRDWGVRIGNWYIIRKITGNDYGDSDSDEWDIMPNLPSPPIFGIDWTPDFSKFPTEIPRTTQRPTTTPKIELITPRQQTTQTVTQTQSDSTSTESTVTTTGTIVTSTESIPLTTQLITISIEPNIEIDSSSEEMITSSESVVMNSVPVAAPTNSTLTSTESITESTVSSVDITMFSVTSTSSTDLTSVKSVETSIESTAVSNETDITFSEELTTTTTTDSPETSAEQILPFFNKRVEDNETVNKRTTKKPRPASAEVITF